VGKPLEVQILSGARFKGEGIKGGRRFWIFDA